MQGTVLIADDDKNLRTVLTHSLTRSGLKVRATATLSTLWKWLEEGEGDVVLTDVNLADGDALDMLPRMRAMRPDLKFVVMSAQNTVLTALRAGDTGAYEYLAKPFDLREMVGVLAKALGQSPNDKVNTEKPTPQVKTEDFANLPLIGRSDSMQDIYKRLAKIIPSDLPLLIEGAPGTGKTLIAGLVHQFGPRKHAPIVNFGGHSPNPNAIRVAFENAGDGVLVFESIDEYFSSEQREIQNLMDSGQYKCRVIATSRRDLAASVVAGDFRDDLFYRINALRLDLPSLRDRLEDIDELAAYFIAQDGQKQFGMTSAAAQILRQKDWRGNIRELRMMIGRAMAMNNTQTLEAEDFADLAGGLGVGGPNENLAELIEAQIRRFFKVHGDDGAGDNLMAGGLYSYTIAQVEKPLISVVLEMTGGNQIRAAKILDINRNTLRKKINDLDILVTKGKKLV